MSLLTQVIRALLYLPPVGHFSMLGMCEPGGVVTHALLTSLPLAFRGGCAHFPMSLELTWVLYECTISYVYSSQCLSRIGDNRKCGRKWDG